MTFLEVVPFLEMRAIVSEDAHSAREPSNKVRSQRASAKRAWQGSRPLQLASARPLCQWALRIASARAHASRRTESHIILNSLALAVRRVHFPGVCFIASQFCLLLRVPLVSLSPRSLAMDITKIADLLRATIDPKQRELAEKQLDEVSLRDGKLMSKCCLRAMQSMACLSPCALA